MNRHAPEMAILRPLHHRYIILRQELGVEQTTNKNNKNQYFPSGY